jgi:NAD(P)-dependent dehydrogenase (short-subunit alcohol dehydrogenase family)
VRPLAAQKRPSPTEAAARYAAVAPLLRGLLSPASGNPDAPYKRIVLRHLAGEALLDFLSCGEAEAIALSVPLTPDYLIRTKRVPLFVASPRYDDTAALREQLTAAVQTYRDEYRSYVTCCGRTDAPPADDADLLPRVVLLPGLGAVCAGETARDAGMAADITAQCLSVKRTIYETGGTYASLSPEHCCAMEFRSYQRAKLAATSSARPLEGCVVLVTGAAGAIGAGLCAALLENGCHLAVSDLAGDALDQTVGEFDARFGGERVLGVAMDVTDSASVEEGFRSICSRFGGLDAAVVNAGIAHVARLADMDMEAFRRLERVNIEGTLLTIREATRLFRLQNTGGDIVLVSTKNVFAPGASFGAYSATKAASHQLARIAALELADLGVRVNMVAPDAVFSHGGRKSGLWAAVGPDRMKARGLDEAGLEEYYRSRNLLKARVTAGHVAAAVLFFLRRETPTTGATIPVDGGLPDATPR